MKKSTVRQAAEEYTLGNYSVALIYYRQLAKQLGEKNFWANIKLCESKLQQVVPGKALAVTPLKQLKIAAVMDEFTYHSYAPECQVLQLTPDDSLAELAEFQPQLLFIESAWRGKNDLWGSKVGHKTLELTRVVQWCNERSIPTVFWNKEDPIHFETFLGTAKLFDFVFTTDIDCIARYKAALGHNNVYFLPFACQPKDSNPIEKYQRKDAFCFAGAYYVRYPERTRDLGNFMTTLSGHRPVEIYDRNFGKDDPNYQFPEEYKPYIVGNLPYAEIDKAYKGYRYAINLNSIKQSQSMFARRVFELLACNTLTVSNFSRGVRLLFGDLVFCSDSGTEILRRLQKLDSDDANLRKLQLAGLRKVMQHHTYQDRLGYIVSKVTQTPQTTYLPHIAVTARAKDLVQLNLLLANFNRQTHVQRQLIVVVPEALAASTKHLASNIHLVALADSTSMALTSACAQAPYIATMVAEDYYGPNYLLDLALATRYCYAAAIGKASFYQSNGQDAPALTQPGQQYRHVQTLPVRCAIIQSKGLLDKTLHEWVATLEYSEWQGQQLLSVDEFNYCKNASDLNPSVWVKVDDLAALDTGLDVASLIMQAESIEAQPLQQDTDPAWSGAELAEYFKPVANRGYQCELRAKNWHIDSTLPDGKHDYLYSTQDFALAELGFTGQARFYLDTTPGLNVQLVLLFLDAKKQRLGNTVKSANRNHLVDIPPDTQWVRLGLRLYGSGVADIKALVFGQRSLLPATVLGRAESLLLTNHYPSYDDLYRNGFVHTRVSAYAEHGVKVDVYRLRKSESLSYHEFNNIDIITGSQEALHKLLSSGQYKNVLVHFLSEDMWAVLQHYIDNIQVFVWVHGAEIQPWHRRDYNNENEDQRQAAIAQSDERMRFWRGLLRDMPERLKLIFVSNYFAEEVMEDIGFRLPQENYKIIHNPIDTTLFAYCPKSVEQRKKILSIRPYASRKYANDLSVQAILALSPKPWFKELEFRMIGDGALFDEVLAPLRQFENVIIERRFLTQQEIAQLHREYGIFLCPTRMDAQGVSRDEAMSSGLVPVTNAVTAIPEFVSDVEGILAPGDDAAAIAIGIERVYKNTALFEQMSASASKRVSRQCSKDVLIQIEMQQFHVKDTVCHLI